MSKDEAIEVMKLGAKVTHQYFSIDEWITMKKGLIVTEEGYAVNPEEFWSYRTDEYWETGWREYKY